MTEIDLLKYYPKSNRPLDERSKKVTDLDREISRKFDFEYFDGNRLYGYGGYNYHSRFWTETVKYIYNHYGMYDGYRLLDTII